MRKVYECKKKSLIRQKLLSGEIKVLGSRCFEVPQELFVIGISPRMLAEVYEDIRIERICSL